MFTTSLLKDAVRESESQCHSRLPRRVGAHSLAYGLDSAHLHTDAWRLFVPEGGATKCKHGKTSLGHDPLITSPDNVVVWYEGMVWSGLAHKIIIDIIMALPRRCHCQMNATAIQIECWCRCGIVPNDKKWVKDNVRRLLSSIRIR